MPAGLTTYRTESNDGLQRGLQSLQLSIVNVQNLYNLAHCFVFQALSPPIRKRQGVVRGTGDEARVDEWRGSLRLTMRVVASVLADKSAITTEHLRS